MPNPTLYDNFNQVRQYIDQNQVDLSSYVSKSELEGMSYATTSYLSNYILTPNIYGSTPGPYKLYAAGLSANTQYKHIYPNIYSYSNFASLDSNAWMSKNTVKNYVEGRIAEIESSYVTKAELANCSYVTSYDLPVIDESIVPNTTATYTLGDESHLYSATYSARLKVGNNSQMYNDGGGITFSVNNNNGIRIGGSTFYPKTSGGYSNGSSTNYWNSTYTSRVDLNSNIALTSDGSGLFIKTAGNLKFSFDTDSFHPYGSTYSGTLDLGTSTRTWRSTYTTNIYTENVSYTSGKSSIKLNDRNVDIWANNKKMINLSDYNGFVPTQTNVNLGGSSNKWAATYTANLYADNIHNFIWTGTSTEYASLPDYTTYQLYLIENE